MGSSLRSLSMKNVVSNDWKTNLVVVLALALCVGYLVNKQNQALVSLLVISGVSYLLNKNVMMSLVIGIAVTSLLVTMNYVKRSEGMKNKDKGKGIGIGGNDMIKQLIKKK
jgi:hypothetical protein